MSHDLGSDSNIEFDKQNPIGYLTLYDDRLDQTSASESMLISV